MTDRNRFSGLLDELYSMTEPIGRWRSTEAEDQFIEHFARTTADGRPNPNARLEFIDQFKKQFPNSDADYAASAFDREFRLRNQARATAQSAASGFTPSSEDAMSMSQEDLQRFLPMLQEEGSYVDAERKPWNERFRKSIARGTEDIQRDIVHFGVETIGRMGATDEEERQAWRQSDLSRQAFESGAPLTTPEDPWYKRGSIQAGRMVPMATLAAATGGGSAAGVGLKVARLAPWVIQGQHEIQRDLEGAGFSPDSAYWAGTISAVPYAYIEFMQMKGIIPKGAEAAARKAAVRSFRQFMQREGVNFLKQGASEYAEEFAQAGVKAVTVGVLEELTGQGVNVKGFAKQQMKDAADSWAPLLFLMLPGHGASTFQGAQEFKQADKLLSMKPPAELLPAEFLWKYQDLAEKHGYTVPERSIENMADAWMMNDPETAAAIAQKGTLSRRDVGRSFPQYEEDLRSADDRAKFVSRLQENMTRAETERDRLASEMSPETPPEQVAPEPPIEETVPQGIQPQSGATTPIPTAESLANQLQELANLLEPEFQKAQQTPEPEPEMEPEPEPEPVQEPSRPATIPDDYRDNVLRGDELNLTPAPESTRKPPSVEEYDRAVAEVESLQEEQRVRRMQGLRFPQEMRDALVDAERRVEYNYPGHVQNIIDNNLVDQVWDLVESDPQEAIDQVKRFKAGKITGAEIEVDDKDGRTQTYDVPPDVFYAEVEKQLKNAGHAIEPEPEPIDDETAFENALAESIMRGLATPQEKTEAAPEGPEYDATIRKNQTFKRKIKTSRDSDWIDHQVTGTIVGKHLGVVNNAKNRYNPDAGDTGYSIIHIPTGHVLRYFKKQSDAMEAANYIAQFGDALNTSSSDEMRKRFPDLASFLKKLDVSITTKGMHKKPELPEQFRNARPVVQQQESKPKKKPSTPRKPRQTSSEKAKDARAELTSKAKKFADKYGNRFSANPLTDPELIRDVADLTVSAIKAGVLTFSDYVSHLSGVMGEKLVRAIGKPLRGAWNRVKQSGSVEGMDDAGDVGEILDGLTAAEETNGTAERGTGSSDVGAENRPGVEEGDTNDVPSTELDGDAESGDTEPRPEAGRNDRDADRGGDATAGSDQPDREAGDVPVPAGRGTRPGEGTEGRAGNYRITESDEIGGGGSKTKVRNNLDALRILRKIQAENRPATREEQAALVKYSGWGHTKGVFDPLHKDYVQELHDLLSPEEYKKARESIKTSHYTSEEVIRSMWSALEQYGFQGGRVYEPAAGVGHFVGLMPSGIQEKSNVTLVELDPITGQIAELLYPDADVQTRGFEDVRMPDGSVDLFISNVPFSKEVRLNDRRDGIKKQSIHNFFFEKAIRKTRPGGIVMFITSSHTMDSKKGDDMRRRWSGMADFLGAVRLPWTAFSKNANTSVVTDILVFQKRQDGQKDMSQPWFTTQQTIAPADNSELYVNEYFVAHPEKILGELSGQGKMHAKRDDAPQMTVIPSGEAIGTGVARELGNLPVNKGALDFVRTTTEEIDRYRGEASPELHNNNYTVKNGELVQNIDGQLMTVELTGRGAKKMRQVLIDSVGVREARRALVAMELSEDATDEQIQAAMDRLNAVYDAFVKKHGTLTENKRAFADDPDTRGALLSLEKYDPDKKTAEKEAIFTTRTMYPFRRVTTSGSVQDALLVSMAEYGGINWDYMSELTGKGREEIIADLGDRLFLNPETKEHELSEMYLSGPVRKKLRAARAAAETDPTFQRNVTALEAVQPVDKHPADIEIQFGAVWVNPEEYEDFIRDVLGRDDVVVNRNASNGRWWFSKRGKVDKKFTEGQLFKPQTSQESDVYGTPDYGALKSMLQLMNAKEIRVVLRTSDGAILDQDQTALANVRAKDLERRFASWLWENPARTVERVNRYNNAFNDYVKPEINGDHLPDTLHGMSAQFKFRPYQKRAIWRAITGGNLLLHHAVGAGKTLEMIAICMERKRLGRARKQMIVTTNTLVLSGQFEAEFRKAYPNANLLIATADDMKRQNRSTFYNRIMNSDWDAIIVPTSSFALMPVSPRLRREYIQRQLDDFRSVLEELRASGMQKRTIKQMEDSIANLESKLNELTDEEKKDLGPYFDELGIDGLLVDEAHNYKRVPIITTRQQVKGVPSGKNSGRAMDMEMKVDYLNRVTNHRGIIFASGTPLSNSMAEIWVLLHYLSPQRLEEQGLQTFDAWAAAHGIINETITQEYTSNDARIDRRFSRFVNLKELWQNYAAIADVILPSDMNIPLPKMDGGKPIIESIPVTPGVREYFQNDLDVRIKGLRHKDPVDPKDNVLRIITWGKQATLDMRLRKPDMDGEPGGKIPRCVQNVVDIWRETQDRDAAQIIWCDLGTPNAERKRNGRFISYDEIKRLLVEAGVPESEIAYIHDTADSNNDRKAAKMASLFKKVNTGTVRILIGNTIKMGEGANIQRKLYAAHHLDAPLRPSDIEQRDGRIVRFGNEHLSLNIPVKVYHYIMEDSMDAFTWSILNDKQKMIQQFFSGNLDANSIDDLSEVSLDAAEGYAAATGDPRILEAANLDREIKQLEAARKEHERNVRMRDFQTAALPGTIAEQEKKLIPLTEDANAAETWSDGELDGKTYDSQESFMQAVEEYQKTMPAGTVENIGRIGKFRILSVIKSHVHENKDGSIGGNYVVTLHGAGVHVSPQAGSFVTALKWGLGVPKTKMNELANSLDADKKRLTALKSAGSTEFSRKAELNEKKARHEAIIAAILADSKNKIQKTNENLEEEDLPDDEDEDYGFAGGAGRRFSGSLSLADISNDAEPVSQDDVVRVMAHEFGTNFQVGRQKRGADASYARRNEMIRARATAAADIAIMAHEFGHHLWKLYDLESEAKSQPNSAAILAELGSLDYEPKGRIHEGFSEFFRHLLTEFDADTIAPETYNWFTDFLDDNPVLAGQVDRVFVQSKKWHEQGAINRVGAQISDTGKPTDPRPVGTRIREWIRNTANRLYTRWKDSGWGLALVSKEGTKRGYTKTTPYQYFMALNKSSMSLAQNAIERGVILLRSGKRITGSFKEIFDQWQAGDEMGNFSKYLYARHALEAWKHGFDPGISYDDARYTFSAFHNARWDSMAQKFTDWNNALIEMLVDAGVLASDDKDRMIAKWSTFIPLVRIMEKPARGFQRSNKIVDASKGVYRRSAGGSKAQILDPIQATIDRVFHLYHRATKQIVIQSLFEMHNEVEGLGSADYWSDWVRPESIKTTFTLADVEDQLRDLGIDIDPTISPMEQLYFWRTSYDIKGREPIVRVLINGEPKLFAMHPELFQSINSMDFLVLPWLLKPFAMVSKLVRVGYTGLRTTFAAKNLARDIATYVQNKKGRGARTYLTPATMVVADAVYSVQKMLGVEDRNALVELFEAFGGSMATMTGADRWDARKRVKGLVTGGKGAAILDVVTHPLDTAQSLLSITESGPRLAEFDAIMRKNGYDEARLRAMRSMGQIPPLPVIVEAINAANDVTVNFKRQGTWGQYFNQIMPFWNANLEAMDKTIRNTKEQPIRTLMLALMSAAGTFLYWMLRRKDDWYKDEEDWLKYGYWVVDGGDGKPAYRIPKPEGVAGATARTTEAILNSIEEESPKDAERLAAQGAADVAKSLLPLDPALVTPILEVGMNEEFFTGRPIVTEGMKYRPAAERANPWNSTLSKEIGKRLGISPAKIDHLLRGYTGGLSENIDFAAKVITGEPIRRQETPFVGGFMARHYSEAMNDFYKKDKEWTDKYGGSLANTPDDVYIERWRHNHYSDIIRDIRRSVQDEQDDDKRFAVERYAIGLARDSMGYDPLKAYPNPLQEKDLPSNVRQVRDQYLGSMTYAATAPSPDRKKRESLDEYKARREKWEKDSTRASDELKRLGVSAEDRREYLRIYFRSRGFNLGDSYTSRLRAIR